MLVFDLLIFCGFSERTLVYLDLCIGIPDGCFGQIVTRSGLSLRHGLEVGAGIIDRDYRGNVGVLVYNLDERQDYWVKSLLHFK